MNRSPESTKRILKLPLIQHEDVQISVALLVLVAFIALLELTGALPAPEPSRRFFFGGSPYGFGGYGYRPHGFGFGYGGYGGGFGGFGGGYGGFGGFYG
ncbi:neuropeptide-like protein 33 [Palaemon carinicauda]|uniref:neuropeptide-like protein 33 n=1 Tax=Palaemon carinicauda TaxID=392227 RepID=UPI0035B63DFD